MEFIMQVIGTAGHVDHGKSTLIESLTGIHPDRLKEEREREMTIVLGFAWMTLPDGEEIGIVDVPGHRDFIENMLSGIGAIDAALFVVAADEGVMPQTKEHLAILDLLQVQGGVVALTKTDLVDDPEWLDLVEADVSETLSGTVLSAAPILRVSAKNGEGLPELISAISTTLANKPPRPDLGRPRLAADRIFTMPGFGTVVTGTLTDGHFKVGEEVEILPKGIRGRIRGLQTHKRKEEIAVPGSRTAMNISGVDFRQVQRGDVVIHPGSYQTSRRMDVHFRLLPDVSQPIKHNTEVKLFIGASEVVSRLRLLGKDVINPGEEGWLQLETRSPVVSIRGDRYILRRPSPGETLGGGVIVDPDPEGRHKRYDDDVIQRLESLIGGTPEEILLQTLLVTGIAPIRDVINRSSLNADVANQALEDLKIEGQILVLDETQSLEMLNSLVTSKLYWSQVVNRIRTELSEYHDRYPLRPGIPREEMKSKLGFQTRVFNEVIKKVIAEGSISEGLIRNNLPGVSAVPIIFEPGYEIEFSSDQHKVIDDLMDKFATNPYTPPTIKNCIIDIGEDLYNALIDSELLIPVSNDVVFRVIDYNRMVVEVEEIIQETGAISVGQMRDQFNTSRRYVLAFLEHLDSINFTIRDGDVRRLKT
jgi:selenocysteine-specific elongation factor